MHQLCEKYKSFSAIKMGNTQKEDGKMATAGNHGMDWENLNLCILKNVTTLN